MPGFDGTGPMGMGPMTGGGRGFCAIPLHAAWQAYTGRRGSAIPYYGVPSFAPEIVRGEELEYLKRLTQSLREELREIEGRMQQIESEKE